MLRRPLHEALRGELDRLELTISRLFRLTVALTLAGSVIHYLLVGYTLALWMALGATVYLAWYSLEIWLRQRRMVGTPLRVATVIVEGTMPWAFILILTFTQGADYALGSWVPPMIYASLMVAATARFRPEAPLLVGLSAALTFPVVYYGVVRGHLPSSALSEPLYQPAMQITRALTLGLGGALGMLVAQALRGAIGRADVIARQRDLFGKYRLEETIASGGMGTVYRATYCPEGGFERDVAVKRIHPHLAQMPRFVESFRSEAELSARLVHPNIVQVLDFGRVEETYFLAMEHIDGITLAELMQKTRSLGCGVAPGTVAHIARQILAGLAYSHAGARDGHGDLLRVVHRDLCPDNVLVSRTGDVKITDFGVARALRDAAAANTRTVVGHVAYMAPEQARAQAIDERCDLFALGIVMWELLCGEPLFDRGGEGPTLLALVKADFERPSSKVGADPSWDAFFERALALEPQDRFPSAVAMMRELDTLADAKPSTIPGAHEEELAHIVRQVSSTDENAVESLDEVAPTLVRDDRPLTAGGGTAIMAT